MSFKTFCIKKTHVYKNITVKNKKSLCLKTQTFIKTHYFFIYYFIKDSITSLLTPILENPPSLYKF